MISSQFRAAISIIIHVMNKLTCLQTVYENLFTKDATFIFDKIEDCQIWQFFFLKSIKKVEQIISIVMLKNSLMVNNDWH